MPKQHGSSCLESQHSEAGQEDHCKFQASLGYIIQPSLLPQSLENTSPPLGMPFVIFSSLYVVKVTGQSHPEPFPKLCCLHCLLILLRETARFVLLVPITESAGKSLGRAEECTGQGCRLSGLAS